MPYMADMTKTERNVAVLLWASVGLINAILVVLGPWIAYESWGLNKTLLVALVATLQGALILSFSVAALFIYYRTPVGPRLNMTVVELSFEGDGPMQVKDWSKEETLDYTALIEPKEPKEAI